MHLLVCYWNTLQNARWNGKEINQNFRPCHLVILIIHYFSSFQSEKHGQNWTTFTDGHVLQIFRILFFEMNLAILSQELSCVQALHRTVGKSQMYAFLGTLALSSLILYTREHKFMTYLRSKLLVGSRGAPTSTGRLTSAEFAWRRASSGYLLILLIYVTDTETDFKNPRSSTPPYITIFHLLLLTFWRRNYFFLILAHMYIKCE